MVHLLIWKKMDKNKTSHVYIATVLKCLENCLYTKYLVSIKSLFTKKIQLYPEYQLGTFWHLIYGDFNS